MILVQETRIPAICGVKKLDKVKSNPPPCMTVASAVVSPLNIIGRWLDVRLKKILPHCRKRTKNSNEINISLLPFM